MGGPEGNRRRWPFGLLGALGLIVAVESTVARHELDFTTPARLEWRQSRQASTAQATACRVLGLGTSMTKLGLFPAVVERESGRSTYNLASCAGRMPGSYYLLRRALEAGAKPEAILLEVHPSYMAVPFQEGLVAWPDILDPMECLDLAWTTGDASFFASTVLARMLPSLNARAEIRAAVLAWLNGEVGSTRPNTSPHLRNLEQNAGAFVRRRDTPYHGEVTPYLEGIYLHPYWACDRVNEHYLRRLLDLCGSKQIQVYWLIPPLVPALQARREQLGLDGAYTLFTRKIQRDYPELVVLDSRRSGYDYPVFSDAAHLDLPGAATLSAEVGRMIKSKPTRPADGSRWVNLPAYRDHETNAPLEDIAQSYREVAGSATLKR